MLGLNDLGLTPGETLQSIDIDNIPEGAMHRPALTTVAIGAREIGEEDARVLLRRIKSPESISAPPKLVIRESCGPRPPV